MDIIKSIEHEQLKNKIPELRVGNTVRVHQRIKEGNRERIQVFEGIIIKKQGGGVNATFTVRRVAYGVGVEKTFLVHSPMVEKVELVRVGKARRAKLYYLRERIGKAAKTKENVTARIENKEITLKEEMIAEPEESEQVDVADESVVVPVEEVPVEETPVETETPATEEADTVKEEVVEKVEKAPVTETTIEVETPATEEADTVKEEVVETVEEAPVEETTIEAETPATEEADTVKEEVVAEEVKEETDKVEE